MSVRQVGTPVRATGSQIISNVPCQLLGLLVNATSSGTVTLFDATNGSGTAFASITPALNTFVPITASCATGLYFTKGGTSIDVTFFVAAG